MYCYEYSRLLEL